MVTLPLPAGIGITAIPNQYQRRAYASGARYNILVVGTTGLGKSTFIQTLLGIKLSSMHCTTDSKTAQGKPAYFNLV